jgi:regulator of protease activity HflC (stomatin/prohibitin superfamily)
MKKNTLILTLLALIGLAMLPSCKRIDAGHTGIKVRLYGSSKGVQDITEVTGMVWYNPFTVSVYEVPTYVQNAVYTKDPVEGSEANEEFRVTTKDGLVASFDVSINYRTPDTCVSKIFRKYRKPFKELSKTIIRNYLRDAFNNVASLYPAEMLYEKRAEYEKQSEDAIKHLLEPEGFIIEQVVILNELRLPESVIHNINEKVNATQIAIKKQQEVAQAEADGRKRIVEAKTDSADRVIRAHGKFNENQVINRSLTPTILEYMRIQKWNGIYPSTYAGGNGTNLLISPK